MAEDRKKGKQLREELKEVEKEVNKRRENKWKDQEGCKNERLTVLIIKKN